MNFVIDRSKWARGDYFDHTNLLLCPEDGSRCCLGFLGRACGIPDNKLLGRGFPSSIRDKWWPLEIVNTLGVDTELCIKLVSVNEDVNISDTKRETTIAHMFKTANIEVKFIDEDSTC